MSEMNRGASPLRQAPTESASAKVQELGPMPIWNLADLYPNPKSKALQADLKKAADEALAIKQRFLGKLAEPASDGTRLAEAIGAYESLSDSNGRLGAYAGLLYAAEPPQPG